MKVQLKQALCDGFGTCTQHAPEMFPLDEWGYASAAHDGKVPPGLEDRVRRAIVACPVHAIVEVADPDEQTR